MTPGIEIALNFTLSKEVFILYFLISMALIHEFPTNWLRARKNLLKNDNKGHLEQLLYQ